MDQKISFLKSKNGFTIIELMIVVSLISLLSGIVLSVVNSGKQQKRAQDATNLSSLTKLASAIESYYYGEGQYPAKSTSDPNGNPLNNSANTSLNQYIKTWPGTTFYYITDGSSPPSKFDVYVQKLVDGRYYKYRSSQAAVCDCSATSVTTIDTCNDPICK